MADYYLKREDLLDICSSTDRPELQERLEKIRTTKDFREFFEDRDVKAPGLWLKDIMVHLGVPEDQISPQKGEKLDWILENVALEGVFKEEKNTVDELVDQSILKEKNYPKPELLEGPGIEPPTACKTTLENCRRFFELLPEGRLEATEALDITRLTIYENIPVEFQDNFCIKCETGFLEFYRGVAAILKWDEQEVAAVGTLQQAGEAYHILLERKNIDYSEFRHGKKYRLALFTPDAGKLFEKDAFEKSDCIELQGVICTVECTIDYKPMVETRNTLCIDFGTSNTSAGSYGILNKNENQIELVPFADVTSQDLRETRLYPTLVYVADCGGPKRIRYLFGYEARRRIMEQDYATEASVFFEIKRWIGTLNQDEEICDEHGNSAIIPRGDIVKAYILHIIDLSEQHFKARFKRLHLSAPVKQKEQFYQEMNAMLGGNYEILAPENSVDEGVAIIYNSISKLVEYKEIGPDRKTSIMILDCGGGTTDLASCEVTAREMETSTKLEITTRFVNGNSNFGGNNITFRIMQLLKIKLAAKYAPDLIERCDMKDLIPMEESQILCQVDETEHAGQYNSDRPEMVIYQQFQKSYQEAEKVIPTVFMGNSEFLYEKQRRKLRRNYYYLWHLAEKIKLRFYEDDLVSVDLRSDQDRPIEFNQNASFYLYVAENGTLEKKEDAASGIEITINEIRRVLCGDIYGLLNELLSQQGLNVDSYDYYRLAGQSCKINLFMELLKEFIPGKKLRTSSSAKRGEQSVKGSARLKLACIQGCIAYIRDKEFGKIHPEMKTDHSALIYDVCARKGTREIPLLSRGAPDKCDFVVIPKKATKVELVVRNSFGVAEKTICVNFEGDDRNSGLDSLFAEMAQRSVVKESVLEHLEDGVRRTDPEEADGVDFVRFVFAIPSSEGYGMNIYRLLKKKEKSTEAPEQIGYFWWKQILYENYENESTKSFFDGSR